MMGEYLINGGCVLVKDDFSVSWSVWVRVNWFEVSWQPDHFDQLVLMRFIICLAPGSFDLWLLTLLTGMLQKLNRPGNA